MFQNASEDRSDFRPNFLFNLEYYNSGYLFEFSNFPKKSNRIIFTGSKMKYPSAKCYTNNGPIDISEAIKALPSNIIANSIMLTDKFFAPRAKKDESEFPIYKYLGVRNRPQQASTRSYVRKTIEFVVAQMNSDVFRQGLLKLTKFLELSEKIEVCYNTIYSSVSML